MNTIKKAFITICIIAALTGYVIYLKVSATQTTATQSITNSTASAPVTTINTSANSTTYKDGIYTAQGVYATPDGNQSITVQVTLKSDIVVDSTVTAEATGGDSSEYQADFINNYKQYVTGKKISDINLTKVARSSLTPSGFDNALQTIESHAKI